MEIYSKEQDAVRLLNLIVYSTTSTTKIVEDAAESSLQVKLLEQKEIEENTRLFRKALLYFRSPKNPVFYAESYFNLKNITTKEQDLLKSGNVPIGRIFGLTSINKKSIQIQNITSEQINKYLNAESDMELVQKKYKLFVKGREIGTIIEYFHEHSLSFCTSLESSNSN